MGSWFQRRDPATAGRCLLACSRAMCWDLDPNGSASAVARGRGRGRETDSKGTRGDFSGRWKCPCSGAPTAPPLAPTHSSRSCRRAQGWLGGRLCVCVETFRKRWSHVRSRQSQVLVGGIAEVRLGHTEADPRQQWLPRVGSCRPLGGEVVGSASAAPPCLAFSSWSGLGL